jgi:hypothetical protein
MPQPTSSDVHVDAILSQISVAYMQSQDVFIANRIFPTISVQKQSDLYFTYNKGDWFRDEAALRAPSTPSAGSGYGLSTATYSASVYAMHKDVDDQTRANADDPINPDREATQFVTQRMLMRQEIDWSSTFFKTGVWDTDKVGGVDFTQWSNYTSSDPIEDIEAGKATMLNSTGYLPNTLVLTYDAMRQLRNHPDVIDRIKYTSANVPTEATLASLFGVDRVLTARGIRNSGAEGAADSFGAIHGKNAALYHVAPSPGLMTPSAGYQFAWDGVSDGQGTTVGISRFRMNELRSDRVEAQMAWDYKVVASDLGYFFSNCVA